MFLTTYYDNRSGLVEAFISGHGGDENMSEETMQKYKADIITYADKYISHQYRLVDGKDTLRIVYNPGLKIGIGPEFVPFVELHGGLAK